MALGLITRFKNQYDKLLAFIVLLGLLGSLLFLAVRIAFMKSWAEEYRIGIDALRPANPEATVVDTLAYEQAERTVEHPIQLTVWTNALLFVPEARVWCTECRQPMPYDGKKCPFCLHEPPPPPPPPEDMDKDGIKDKWELLYGLDPNDPSDAAGDPDGDKFSNLEEYSANPQTDPTDKDDAPDIVAKLRVREVIEDNMSLRFEGKSKLSETKIKFQVNVRIGRHQKTFILFLKEKLGPTGFILDRFEEKFAQVESSTGTRKREVSVLYLVDGDKEVALVFKEDTPWREYSAVLYLDWGDQPSYTVEMDSEFELEAQKYTVIGIDSKKQTVVIKRASDGRQFTVAKSPAVEERAGE
jgi:hypothetical protein